MWPISLSRAVTNGGHRLPTLFASSTHKTPVRDHTPLLGHTPSRRVTSGGILRQARDKISIPENRMSHSRRADRRATDRLVLFMGIGTLLSLRGANLELGVSGSWGLPLDVALTTAWLVLLFFFVYPDRLPKHLLPRKVATTSIASLFWVLLALGSTASVLLQHYVLHRFGYELPSPGMVFLFCVSFILIGWIWARSEVTRLFWVAVSFLVVVTSLEVLYFPLHPERSDSIHCWQPSVRAPPSTSRTPPHLFAGSLAELRSGTLSGSRSPMDQPPCLDCWPHSSGPDHPCLRTSQPLRNPSLSDLSS